MANYFYGFKPNIEVKAKLVGLLDIVRPLSLSIKEYTNPENLHLTHLFLGQIDETQAREAKKILEQFSLLCGSFTINHLELLGRPPRMLYASGEASKEIFSDYEKLLKSVKQRHILAKNIIPREIYRPHITLARLSLQNSQNNSVQLPEIAPFVWELKDLKLFTRVNFEEGYRFVEV